MSLNYVIIDDDVVPQIDFNQVQETNDDTLRWNVEGTQTLVKFSSSEPVPSFLVGKTQYTHAEILTIMQTTDWTGPIE